MNMETILIVVWFIGWFATDIYILARHSGIPELLDRDVVKAMIGAAFAAFVSMFWPIIVLLYGTTKLAAYIQTVTNKQQ